MIINGRAIAEDIFRDLKERVLRMPRPPRLTVITCAPNFETQRYLAIKKKKAEDVGIRINVIELPEDVTNENAAMTIEESVKDSDGIIIQLPFPPHIDREALIRAIPPTHDVDAFLIDDREVFPPVVGAMSEVVRSENVEIENKRAVVIGGGRLVGLPAAHWLKERGANVRMVTKDTDDMGAETADADIIVLGAGKPGLLQPDMIRDGVVILDAGTSEESGELRGDADPRCAEKASVFTPVPGGIGPITVAILLRNLVILATRKE